MKTNYPRYITAAMAGLAFACLAGPVRAQTDIVNNFDTYSETNQWSHWWGGAGYTIEFDAAKDAANNAGSGSMKVTINFDVATLGTDNQFCFLRNIDPAVFGTNYTNLSMDIFIDPSSPVSPGGDFGFLKYGIRHSDWSQDYFGSLNLPTNGGWIHLETAIPTWSAPPDDIGGLTFQMWSGDASGFTGTMVFWVDNIRLAAVQKPPPPVVNTFDDASEVSQWSHWWGDPTYGKDFDPIVDAADDFNSGSMKVTINFDLAAFGGGNQFSFLLDLAAAVDGTRYATLSMDILVDPSSPTSTAGNYGYLEYGIRHSDWSQDYFGNTNLPITGGWIHLETPIPVTHDKIEDIAGLTFKMWSGDPATGFTGTMVFWVDNITLAPKTVIPTLNPTLALQPSGPCGLRLFANVEAAQWQRQNIRTVVPSYSWTSCFFDPVEYSFTIAEFPGKANDGFQAHMFLAPGTFAATVADPDWSQANTIFLQVSGNADGSASARFMYKTNQPGANSMMWNDNIANGPVGTLATIWSPQPAGTWTLTCSVVDNSITLTTPSGTSTNFSMPDESLALFANPLYAYFGIQPNDPKNIGQSATFSRIKIDSADLGFTPIDETFSSPTLDPAIWETAASDAAGIMVIPADARYWLNWTLPAGGFVVEATPSLAPGTWADSGLTNILINAGKKNLLVCQPDLVGTNGFFRLIKK